MSLVGPPGSSVGFADDLGGRFMSEIDIIIGAVLATFGGEVAKTAGVPLDVARERIRERMVNRLQKARSKTDAKIEEAELSINDRVAHKALTEVAITDDDVSTEYLTGVIAASGPGDDAGAPVVAQVGRLSAKQLLLHYGIYRELVRLWPVGRAANVYSEDEMKKIVLRLSAVDLLVLLGQEDLGKTASLSFALSREELIGNYWKHDWGTDDPGGGYLEVRPSALGAELFLWGNAVRGTDGNQLFRSPSLKFLTEVPATPFAKLVVND